MGHHNIRYSGDRYSDHGAWSPTTSRANFCEEDYIISFYLAEFINSLSNIAYVYLALRSMYGPGSRGLFKPKWDFMSVSLLVLGIGSFLFHATLRQALEFVDEFSMLGLAWSMLQATLTARQPPQRARAIMVGLAVFYLSFAVFYIWTAKIIYQVFAFMGSLITLLCRTQYMFYWNPPACFEARRKEWIWRSLKSIGICLVGYVLWSIDLEYCAELRALRQQVGLPWAWLLEFHGWWHIFTAIGASQGMQVAREAREVLEMERDKKGQ